MSVEKLQAKDGRIWLLRQAPATTP